MPFPSCADKWRATIATLDWSRHQGMVYARGWLSPGLLGTDNTLIEALHGRLVATKVPSQLIYKEYHAPR